MKTSENKKLYDFVQQEVMDLVCFVAHWNHMNDVDHAEYPMDLTTTDWLKQLETYKKGKK